MILNNMKYSYNDIAIMPATISEIEHRSECDPFDDYGYLPIFTAPMSSVVDETNWKTFEDNKIHTIIPRTVEIDKRLEFLHQGIWTAFGLSEFKKYFVEDNPGDGEFRVLIDIANGHMKKLYDLVKEAKSKIPYLKIMVGNIANPKTYEYILYNYPAGMIDYIRLGIGAGAGCITSSNVSIHYPMASLISECFSLKDNFSPDAPKLVADGGIRNYSDVIKALALGADYVMIGGLFSSCIESCAKTYLYDENDPKMTGSKYYPMTNEQIQDYLENKYSEYRGKVYKKFYGMASKEGQIDLNGSKTHTSEGIAKYIKVKYRLSQWTENMADYLRSAMSYTGYRELSDFIGAPDCVIISGNTYNSLNK